MAIIYTKQDQGRILSVCNSLPVHTGNTGDEAINITTGEQYIYKTSWELSNIYITGGTFSSSTLTLNNNNGDNVIVTGFTSGGGTDYYVTGFTYDDANTFTISRNGGLSDISTSINVVTGLTTDYFDFNTTYTGATPAEGRMYWDEDNQTITIGMHNGVSLQTGQETYYLIKNQSGSTIQNGRVVRAAGTLGNSGRILGEYMIADGSIPYYYTLGIATEDILNGDDGYVTEFGLVRGIDTTGSLYGETWTGGTILYVHPTIPGGLTSIEPNEPNLKIQIAIVIDDKANGSLFVRPSLSYNLGDLHNIQTSGETDGDLISYNSSQGYWDYTKLLRGDYTITGSLSASSISAGTISASTYQNLPIDPNYYVTGGTYNSGTTSIDYSGNVGFTPFSVNVSSLVDGLWSQSGSSIYYNGGNVGIGVSDPTFNLDIVSSGGTGSYEDIARFRTIDSTDYLALTNAISTDGTFNPVLRAFNNTNVSTNFYLQSVIDPSVDTGVNPLITLQGRVNTEPGVDPWSGVTTRPILRVRNNSTNLLDVTADGKVGIGTTTPTGNLDVSNGTDSFTVDLDDVNGATAFVRSSNPDDRIRLAASTLSASISMGMLGSSATGSTTFGGPNDAYILASSVANNLNIINTFGAGNEDSINFYAGNNATATPHVHIHGSGSTKGYVGIGTETPTNIFEVVQGSSSFYTQLDNVNGPISVTKTTDTNNLVRLAATDGINSVNIGIVGETWTGSTGFGIPSDTYIYANSSSNGLNIINAPAGGKEDYIRFYAGENPLSSTAHIHIDGDGSNKGWIGIGTETPANPLHIYSSGSTYVSKIENDVTDTRLRFKGSSTTNEPWIGSNVNKFQIGHVTSGATLTVTDAGNVGIGTDIPEDTLTVLGSFNLREYGTITAPISSPGWYRLGYTSGSNRGGIRVVISYIGGSFTPVTYVINAFKNWTDVSSLSLEKYGSSNYITEARIIEDENDSTTYHLEVYLTTLIAGQFVKVYLDKNLGYEGTWNLNTGSLSASTSTATEVARSPFTISDGGYTLENLVINDNVNNQFWKFEDTIGKLEIKDWNSDNLITFDGVNDRVGIGTTTPEYTLDILGKSGSNDYEDVVRIGIEDTGDNLVITNGTSNNGIFAPVIRSYQSGSTSPFYLQGTIDSSVDTGVNPLIRLEGRALSGSVWQDVTTRNILQVSNNNNHLMTIDSNGFIGIGTTTPSHRLSIYGSSGLIENRVDRPLPYTSEIYGQTTNASGSSVIQLVNDINRSIVMGVLGSNRDASVAYGGESNDAFLFASTAANNLNIFNSAGAGNEDSINFYAGNNATATPHVHIHGSGSTKGYVGIGTNTPNKKLEVIGEAQISGSGQNVLTIIGSGDTNPLFTVQGSNGQLFSVTDSLIGDLFSVNDISGLPILKVNSDDEILMGNYQSPSLNTTFKTSINNGLTELYSIPISAYTGGFFEYTLTGTGARAGSIMSIFSGSSVNFTETTTTDIGDTSQVTFDMNVSGGTANLTVSATTGTWEIKTIVRSI